MSLLKCASIEDHSEAIQAKTFETTPTRDIFSRHLNEQLLHKVLEYDAKSTGCIAMANKDLQKLATGSQAFTFFEEAGWDMTELANIWKLGDTETETKPELEAEKAKIMALSHIKDENVFDETLETLLFKDKVFKELSGPVLKYLVRRFYERRKT